jgi:hypothetical protein
MDRQTTDPQDRKRRRGLAVDLTALTLVGVLLVAALAAGGVVLYRQLYSPTAFVQGYLELLAEGRAADALQVPGVAVSSAQLDEAGLPAAASDALLRNAVLTGIDDVEPVSSVETDGVHEVTVGYTVDGEHAESTFSVTQAGWIGVVPRWRFAQSPLAILDVVVRGSMRFDVNGFEIDKRQVSVDGPDARPLDAVPMLVFSPGNYQVSVDTAISATPGEAVLATDPMTAVDVDLQAEPTPEFIDVVQKEVETYLDDCATQQILQPTGCPFGYYVQDRLDGLPTWTITEQPQVDVEPSGADWLIPPANGVAQIYVNIVSLFDGTVSPTVADVPFSVHGQITVLPDGKASIRIGD